MQRGSTWSHAIRDRGGACELGRVHSHWRRADPVRAPCLGRRAHCDLARGAVRRVAAAMVERQNGKPRRSSKPLLLQ